MTASVRIKVNTTDASWQSLAQVKTENLKPGVKDVQSQETIKTVERNFSVLIVNFAHTGTFFFSRREEYNSLLPLLRNGCSLMHPFVY